VEIWRDIHHLKNRDYSAYEKPVISNQFFNGLQATLEILQEKMGGKKGTESLEKNLAVARANEFNSVPVLHATLQKLLDEAEVLTGNFKEDSEAAWWADSFASQVHDAFNELYESSPWLSIPSFPERFDSLKEKLIPMPTLEELASLELDVIPQVHVFDEEELNAEEKIWLENFRNKSLKPAAGQKKDCYRFNRSAGFVKNSPT
jgi:hypothetical protein